jgi:nucleoside-diphosphate-sugar epimerase
MRDSVDSSSIQLPDRYVDLIKPKMHGRRVCLTGGAGFIGGHLLDALVSMGAMVTIIDDLSNSSLEHLASVMDQAPDQVRFVQGSILDPEALVSAFENVETVFHLAALGSVPKSVEDPARTWTVNATGTMRVLQAASEAGAQRVVYSASSSAYGNNPALPKVESMAVEAESPYAAAKHASESLCRTWSACYGLDTVSLRYFNIFGSRQAADSAYAAVIPAFVTRYLSARSPTIFGDGEQTRDFTHVSNAVLANLLAASSEGQLGGRVLNVGAGVRTSVNQLASMIAQILGTGDIEPSYEPERVGEVRDSVSSIEETSRVLGYEATTSIEIGLRQTVGWYRDEFLRLSTEEREAS